MTKSPCDGRWPRNSSFSKKTASTGAVSCSRGSRRSSSHRKGEPTSMVRRSRAPLLAASLIACGLAGCSSVTPIATNVDTPGMPNAEVALQKSMDETSSELDPDRRDAAGRGRRIAADGCSGRARAGGGDVVERGARWGGEEARRHDRLPRRRQRQCVAGGQCRRRSGSTAGLRHSSWAWRSGRRRSRRSGSMRSISFSR